MKCASRIRLSGVFCLVMANAGSGQAPIESHEEFLCTSGPAKRIVSIYKNESGACRVDYTRDGKTKTLWMSKADYAYCTTKALSLVTHLVEAKYSCKPKTVEQPEQTTTPEQVPTRGDTPNARGDTPNEDVNSTRPL